MSPLILFVGGAVALGLVAYGASAFMTQRQQLLAAAKAQEAKLLLQAAERQTPEEVADKLCTKLALGATEASHEEGAFTLKVLAQYAYVQTVVDYKDGLLIYRQLDGGGAVDGFRYVASTSTTRVPGDGSSLATCGPGLRTASALYVSLQALRVALTDEIKNQRGRVLARWTT